MLAASVTLSSGCKVGPDFAGPPCPPTPREWTQAQEESVRTEAPALDDWWEVFDDPTLNTILANVNEQNLSLRAAAWKIYQARATLCTTRGDPFPAIGGDAAFSRSKIGTGDTSLYTTTWSWDIAARWEVDIFGQIKRYVEAAEAELEATEDDYRNVKMLLMAETATNYINARLCQERMEIIRANILQQRDFLRIIEARYKAGKDDRLTYSQAVANLNTVEAQFPSVMSEYRAALNRLSVLMGCPPGTIDDLMKKVQPIPVAPDAIAASIPADILRRRPDIRALEHRLAAQTARIGIAEAELYPKFYINGTFGVAATDIEDLFDGHYINAGITPSLSWRILEFGRVRCAIMKQEGITEQMKYDYQNAVLEAAEEVDNAISSYVRFQQRVEFLEESVIQYRDALQLSQKLYESGRNDYLSVLDSQRNVLTYEEMLAVARSNLASCVVRIYKALGGGWQIDPVASSTTQQVDRFRNRSAGAPMTSSAGEGVNLNGSVGMRALDPAITKPSSREKLETKRDISREVMERQQKELKNPIKDGPELLPEIPKNEDYKSQSMRMSDDEGSMASSILPGSK